MYVPCNYYINTFLTYCSIREFIIYIYMTQKNKYVIVDIIKPAHGEYLITVEHRSFCFIRSHTFFQTDLTREGKGEEHN